MTGFRREAMAWSLEVQGFLWSASPASTSVPIPILAQLMSDSLLANTIPLDPVVLYSDQPV